MEMKCMVNCNGIGYENFKAGEIRDVSKETAEKLMDFGYAEKASTEKASSKQAPPQKVSNKKKGAGAAVKTDDTGKNASEGEAEDTDNSDQGDGGKATEE